MERRKLSIVVEMHLRSSNKSSTVVAAAAAAAEATAVVTSGCCCSNDNRRNSSSSSNSGTASRTINSSSNSCCVVPVVVVAVLVVVVVVVVVVVAVVKLSGLNSRQQTVCRYMSTSCERPALTIKQYTGEQQSNACGCLCSTAVTHHSLVDFFCRYTVIKSIQSRKGQYHTWCDVCDTCDTQDNTTHTPRRVGREIITTSSSSRQRRAMRVEDLDEIFSKAQSSTSSVCVPPLL